MSFIEFALSCKGIPYAEPPIDDLRFQPPVANKGWNGTKDGSISAPQCVQGFPDPETTHDQLEPGNSVMFGQEDCLTLNVYTRDTSPSEMFPVFVWFHGGGLSTGQGDMYGPQFFIEYNIMIVTVNYRLGPLGELSLDTELVSGNQVEKKLFIRSLLFNLGSKRSSIGIAVDSE